MKRSVRIFLILTGVLALRIAAHSAAAKVVLRPESEVQAAHAVTLRDIASISGPQALVGKIGEIQVSAGPLAGERRTVDASYIRLKLGAINTSVPVKLVGPDKITVMGKCARISSSQLADEAKMFLTSQLPSDDTTYEVEVDRQPREIVVPAGSRVEVKPRLLTSAVRCGLNTIGVDVVVDGKNEASTSVALRAKSVAETLVATGDIRQGEALSEKNTSWEKRDITKISSAITRSSGTDAVERIARRGIKSGSIITTSDADLPPAVRKGDTVNLVVRCGNVTLRATGEAKQDGRIGESVRVFSTVSQGDVRARVIEPGIVEIRG
ncbi:MAG: flagellar basal body P-ring formation chaperone FlgA [Armatimonadetes bacterium]|nr:flagellar basal body P-ring formation chaperone FlgA [Armatimonadota bacterium]